MSNRRLPAEWESQSGIMLTWPHENTGWGKMLDRVEPVFAEIAARASQYEQVLIVCRDQVQQQKIIARIENHKPDATNIRFAVADSNDSWARDHGPVTVLDESNKPLLLDFQFNGWGNKYPAELDNQISTRLMQQNCFHGKLETINFILEGGSIESDGEGTLLTTACLLSPHRNKGWSQDDIESELKKQFNLKQVHWLHEGGIEGDDTDAHIDTLARLIANDKIMYVNCNRIDDPHYVPLQAMEKELQSLRTLDGKPYELIPLPLPEAVINSDGDRLPATYANFLIINRAVLVPIYQQSLDEPVIEIFKQQFTDREVIAIDCLPLIEQFGSLHCVTMQFPAGVLAD